MLNGREGGGLIKTVSFPSPLFYALFFSSVFLASQTAAVSLHQDQCCVTARSACPSILSRLHRPVVVIKSGGDLAATSGAVGRFQTIK